MVPLSEAAAVRLGVDEVHVWLVEGEGWPAGVLEAYEPLLSDAEHTRRARFVFQRDRDRYLVTRALVRTTLSIYVPGVPADAWTFAENAWGRPDVAGPTPGLHLRFNVSHTDGLIACAVTRERELGVDVEYVARRLSVRELAPTVFAEPELESLLGLPEDRQRERFFALWTLKEAYIKARGMGLSLPLQRFSYDFEGARPRLTIDAELGDEGETWQLHHERVRPEHHFALAVRRPVGTDLTLRWRSGLPLGEWSPLTSPPVLGGVARSAGVGQ